PGQHHHLDLGVLGRPVEGVVEGVGHRRVLRVAVPRPVHRDEPERTAHLVADDLVAHDASSVNSPGASPSSAATTARWWPALPHAAAWAQARLANRWWSYSVVYAIAPWHCSVSFATVRAASDAVAFAIDTARRASGDPAASAAAARLTSGAAN